MKWIRRVVLVLAVAVFAISFADQSRAGETRVTWAPVNAMFDRAVLTVSGPGDVYFQKSFEAGAVPCFSAVDENGVPLPDGSYRYELTKAPYVSPEVREALFAAREAGDKSLIENLQKTGKLPRTPTVESGSFSIRNGSLITSDMVETQPDVTVPYTDPTIRYSLCVGGDCLDAETFGADTIRLKENNLRIHFHDTSNSASFPTNDWRITINDQTNGGANKFSIDDVDAGRTPFTIEAGSRANALYVDASGRVGLGTSTPAEDLHIWYGDTPTIRLAQSGGGWAPQTWDISGNEANFFIRDITNASKLPFRIQPNTPSNTFKINSDGQVVVGMVDTYKFTPSSTATLHVEGDAYIKTALEIGSSRDLKENIRELALNEAVDTLKGLKPVKFHYKTKPDENLGFISEDVPDLVATKSRKSLNTMDIVAVLTRVVQEQQDLIKKQQEDISRLYRLAGEFEKDTRIGQKSQPVHSGIGNPRPNARLSSFTRLDAPAGREGEI